LRPDADRPRDATKKRGCVSARFGKSSVAWLLAQLEQRTPFVTSSTGRTTTGPGVGAALVKSE
jgi:hypothetical protein